MFLGRIIDGLTGGDTGTIFAYVADVTEPHERGKKFGILGATVGIGFILGPTIGGILSHIGLSIPFYAACLLTIVNMIFGYFVLPESLDRKHRTTDFSLSLISIHLLKFKTHLQNHNYETSSLSVYFISLLLRNFKA